MMNIVKIKSVAEKGSKPLVLNYDDGLGHRDVYTFGPGDEYFVPLEVAAVWLGDPRITNTRPGARERMEHYDRKRAWWSFAIGHHTEEDWQALKPPLEVWTTDPEPQRVLMLLDDPDGSAGVQLDTKIVTPESNIANLERTVMAQQAQIDKLVTLLQSQKAATAVDPHQVDTPPSDVSLQHEDHVPEPPDDSDAKDDAPAAPTGRRR